jgi:hypothetical protein
MPTPTQRLAPILIDDPAVLWGRVLEARSNVHRQRRSPINGAHADARATLLKALESYAASLTTRRRPIPYALRDELSLMRLTRHR